MDTTTAIVASRVLEAVAEPSRLGIIHSLRGGLKNVGQISKEVGVPTPNISHHLNIMRVTGLVLSRREGRFVYYFLNPEVFYNRSPGEFCLVANGYALHFS